jgi:hypothetical protein
MRFVRLAILLGGVLLGVVMYRGATNEDVLSPGKAAAHYASFVVAVSSRCSSGSFARTGRSARF